MGEELAGGKKGHLRVGKLISIRTCTTIDFTGGEDIILPL